MSSLTQEQIQFLLTPETVSLKQRAIKWLGGKLVRKTVETTVMPDPEISVPAPIPQVTESPLDLRLTGDERIAAAKRSVRWQRVDEAQAAFRAADEAKASNPIDTVGDLPGSDDIVTGSGASSAGPLRAKRIRGQGLSAAFTPLGVPASGTHIPRHAGEHVDEAIMPALVEAPKHSAGEHMAEWGDTDEAPQQFMAQDGQPVGGRHVADVPVDFVQPVPGKHRAPQ